MVMVRMIMVMVMVTVMLMMRLGWDTRIRYLGSAENSETLELGHDDDGGGERDRLLMT